MQTALPIADEEGLEAVSMRRIAKELGAGAMSLYHYFDSRDELLRADGGHGRGGDARARAARTLARGADRGSPATAARRSCNHPWMLATLQERPQVSPNLLRHIEQSAQSVAGLAGGVAPELLSAIVIAVDDYTVGYTLRELAARHARRPRPQPRCPLRRGRRGPARPLPARERRVPDARRSSPARGGRSPMQDFELGLNWLLDGFAAQIG